MCDPAFVTATETSIWFEVHTSVKYVLLWRTYLCEVDEYFKHIGIWNMNLQYPPMNFVSTLLLRRSFVEKINLHCNHCTMVSCPLFQTGHQVGLQPMTQILYPYFSTKIWQLCFRTKIRERPPYLSVTMVRRRMMLPLRDESATLTTRYLHSYVAMSYNVCVTRTL